ncbi:MAG TPA: hypothetical protein VII38_21530, partial [Polyangia bacterium]
NQVADVSSLAAWKRSFIAPTLSDAEKAQAVWRSVVAFRQQDTPAEEFLESSTHPHDPIKLFNVYGYAQCDCASAAVEALSRAVGLDARGRILREHSVPEVSWSGAWHMLDAAYINQFPKPDGTLAGVDDLVAQVSGWLALHPTLAGNAAGLEAMRETGAWQSGPALLAASPFYSQDGLFPAGVQGWPDTMISYDGTENGITEYGYTLGYQVNIQLRKGERLTRNWSNQGRHINDDLGLPCQSVNAVPGQGALGYSPAYGDLAPGRVGNGTLEWEVPLSPDELKAAALDFDNLVAGPTGGAKIEVSDQARPGLVTLRMPSSYVYLDGALTVEAQIGSGGQLAIFYSENHGLDWTPLATLTDSGSRTIDLSPLVRRRYDYQVRFQLSGAGTGLSRVNLTDAIQYSQRALPALAAGDNSLSFTAGPNEGTITLEGATDRHETRNLNFTAFHPQLDGVTDAPLQLTRPTGTVTFPIATPGDLVRLRFGAEYRARDPNDGWDYQVSFDGGQSFQTVGRAAGPTPGNSEYLTFDAVPPGTRQALVRFAGTQQNTTEIFSFRIDADYAEPHGGFRPVKITYVWEENGQLHTDVHVATSPAESYTLHCGSAPRMRSIALELAE